MANQLINNKTISYYSNHLILINFYKVDFGNGSGPDNIIIGFPTLDKTAVRMIFIKNSQLYQTSVTQPLSLLTWTHLSFTFDSGTAKIYVNGQQVFSQQGFSFNNIVRTKNYIGHSNYNGDPDANAIYDEIKIFKRPLSPAEVSAEMYMIEPFQRIIF